MTVKLRIGFPALREPEKASVWVVVAGDGDGEGAGVGDGLGKADGLGDGDGLGDCDGLGDGDGLEEEIAPTKEERPDAMVVEPTALVTVRTK